MRAQIIYWCGQLTALSFWEGLLASFEALGPFVPICLAAVESLVPALPLVAIVTVNVAAHGAVLGFFYSWLGTCIGCTIVFFFFRLLFKRLAVRLAGRNEKVRRAREWVNGFDLTALFFIAVLPFTPSSFLNFAFGVSDLAPWHYLRTMYAAKLIMILLLALFGQSCVQAAANPWFLLLAVGLLAVLYAASKRMRKKHDL
jgi:uncharacterized membrane protein YdjX (TVP38/TMEM64 family)